MTTDALGPAVSETDPVFQDLYGELKRLASRQRVRNGSPATLCTTELVHEMYLRIGESNFEFRDTGRFFAYAARAMRCILIDAARRRGQESRGGGRAHLEIDDEAVNAVYIDPELALHLDGALNALQRDAPRAAQVVELHYFAGLGLERVGSVLGIAKRTVDRDWRFARAFLAGHASGSFDVERT